MADPVVLENVSKAYRRYAYRRRFQSLKSVLLGQGSNRHDRPLRLRGLTDDSLPEGKGFRKFRTLRIGMDRAPFEGSACVRHKQGSHRRPQKFDRAGKPAFGDLGDG